MVRYRAPVRRRMFGWRAATGAAPLQEPRTLCWADAAKPRAQPKRTPTPIRRDAAQRGCACPAVEVAAPISPGPDARALRHKPEAPGRFRPRRPSKEEFES